MEVVVLNCWVTDTKDFTGHGDETDAGAGSCRGGATLEVDKSEFVPGEANVRFLGLDAGTGLSS
jgi:hypothetical protein